MYSETLFIKWCIGIRGALWNPFLSGDKKPNRTTLNFLSNIFLNFAQHPYYERISASNMTVSPTLAWGDM